MADVIVRHKPIRFVLSTVAPEGGGSLEATLAVNGVSTISDEKSSRVSNTLL